jgi:thiosulfate dehydrogenase [quinone] large subunit
MRAVPFPLPARMVRVSLGPPVADSLPPSIRLRADQFPKLPHRCARATNRLRCRIAGSTKRLTHGRAAGLFDEHRRNVSAMANIAKDHNADVRTSVPAAGLTPLLPNVAGHQPAAGEPVRPTRTPTVPRPGPAPTVRTEARPQLSTAVRYLLEVIRLALGWIFLWAFMDKTFGLGHDTTAAKSWINGGSPTKGFLGSAAKGPFTGFYHSIAGGGVTDLFFMGALLAVGVALILGVAMRLAAGAGALLTLMMWTAVLPPASNPFMDDHIIYAAVLIVLALLGAGSTLGLGAIWAGIPLVRRTAWLK